MRYLKFMFIITLAGFTFAACGNGGENSMENVQESSEQAANDAMNSISQEFVSNMQSQQDSLNQEMNEVQETIDQKSGELEPGIQQRWEDLKVQKQELQGLFEKVKSGDVQNFQQVKTDLQNQLTKFKENLAQLKKDVGMA